VGELLTASSQMTCPHGGVVSSIPANSRVSIGGAPVVLATDTFVIAGCALSAAMPPSPCVQVNWIVPSSSITAGGSAALTTDSTGLCVAATGAAQGSVLVAAAAQAQVSGS
jgi:hypothetical protein